MIKDLFRVSIALAIAGIHSIAIPEALAQEPAASQDTLEVIATNGAGHEKHRFSVDGMVPPFVIRPNQTVPVTLQFPTTAAGTPVAIAPLDGGRISGGGNGAVSPVGRMLFTFSPGATPGRYRVMLYLPGEQHLLEFYVADANHNPWQQPAGSSH